VALLQVSRRSWPTEIAYWRVEAVRAWAIEQGIEVNARGRIASSIVERFNATESEVADVAARLDDAVAQENGKGKKRRRKR
jgi:hypothetical protein